MKPIFKYIKESIQRGVNLTIDDFDVIQDIDIQKTGEIKNEVKTQDYFEFQNLIEKFESDIYSLTVSDVEQLGKLHKQYGFTYKLTNNDKNLFSANSILHLFIEYIDTFSKHNFNLNWINTSEITTMKELFLASKFNGDISEWDVSNVKSMAWMFYRSKFNGDISNWNVSNVEDMCTMFTNSKFNQDISNWDVHNVKNMKFMFYESPFNQDISNWDVKHPIQCTLIFEKCSIKDEYKPHFGMYESIQRGYNLAIDDFDEEPDIELQKTGKIKNISITKDIFIFKDYVEKVKNHLDDITVEDFDNLALFSKKTDLKYKVESGLKLWLIIKHTELTNSYNADLNWIDTSNITDMSELFYDTSFDGDISEWDTSHVTNMQGMFFGSYFNGDISKWDTSHVTDMQGMFCNSEFNKDISNWNVSNVNDFCSMFYNTPFNKDLSNWNIKPNANIEEMFDECKIKKSYKPIRCRKN